MRTNAWMPAALALAMWSAWPMAAHSTPAGQAAAEAPQEVKLIPRAALFGNPVKAGGQLSPDGRHVSWVAPVEGVMNVWVAPAAKPSEGRPLTQVKDRPITSYFWSEDSSQILFVKDQGGDENFRLYGVDVGSGKQRDYTPFEKVRVRIIQPRSSQRPQEMLVGINQRDPRWHDVHVLNLKTGELKLVMKGDGLGGVVADDSLTVRLASRPNQAGGADMFKVVDGQLADKPWMSTTLEDSGTEPVGLTRDGKTLYLQDTRGRDKAALFAEDLATGERKLLAQDARADLGDAMQHPVTGEIQAYAVEYLKTEWHFLDQSLKADFDWLKSKLGDGELKVLSRTQADDRWLVAMDAVSKVATTYVFDRKAKRLTPLYVSRPELQDAPLVAMHGVEIKARDGLVLPSYLSLPQGAGTADKPAKPVPMVLLVHGGPWGRDSYGYNSMHQWLANRGYAVLAVNFRASTGFGKQFLNAGNLQWGKAMHADLLDAVEWAVQRGVTTRDKVAIMGASYGGYAALAGVAFTPKTFACAVDVVGPSNLETLLGTVPPYWEALRKQFHRRMGDPATEEGRALLRAASPLYKAGQIERPLLIGQGANDPRVKQAESDQIVQAMQERKIPVTYVLYPDEGHGFQKPANRISFNAVAESFLGQCLGGRVEPLGDTVSRSTAQVVTGAEHVPGLAAAAKR